MKRLGALPAVLGCVLHVSEMKSQSITVAPATKVSSGTDLRPLNEPHLAVDPRDVNHLLAVAMASYPLPVYRDIQLRRTCIIYDSRDGGKTWSQHEFALLGCIDPWVAFTVDGHALFAALGSFAGINAPTSPRLLVFRSADGGRNWPEAPIDLGGRHDHEMIVADPARAGWAYLISSRDSPGAEGKLRWSVEVLRTRDRGRTFDSPTQIIPGNLMYKAETPVMLANGTLVVSFVDVARNNQTQGGGADLERRRAWVTLSTDGGTTFGLPLFATDACGGQSQFSLSSTAADTAAGQYQNRLYFACEQRTGMGVAVTWSADLGETWPDTVVSLRASPDATVRRYKPALAAYQGILAASWIEVSGSPPRPGSWTHCLSLYFAASADGGQHFSEPKLVSRSCPDAAQNGANSPAAGDYYGLVALPNGRFQLLWPDARDGAFQLWTTVVTVGR